MIFNHFDQHGHAIMVDVSRKQPTMRIAIAEGVVHIDSKIIAAITDGSIAKGDVLGVARLAGIQAVKKTSELIPLSHPLAIHHTAIDFDLTDNNRIIVRCTVKAFERTGVEMEAMTGASLASLTIYDMCKGADKSISIGTIRLLYKEGGKSGTYRREAP